MESRREALHAALPAGSRLAYDRLASAVDSYAMAIAGLLLEERKFGRDAHGRLEESTGALAACEQRRRAIEAAYLRLIDPAPPVYDEARIYEELGSLEERKRLLIHPLERRLQQAAAGDLGGDFEQWRLQRAKSSGWLFDRIIYYLHGAYGSSSPTFMDLTTSLDFEVARLETLDEPDTLVGLYYALDSLEKRGRREPGPSVPGEILDRIEAAIQRWNRLPGEPDLAVAGRWDANHKVRRGVERLRKLGAV
jgi:hypothetical protein